MFGEERNSAIEYEMIDTKRLQEIRSESSQEQSLIYIHFSSHSNPNRDQKRKRGKVFDLSSNEISSSKMFTICFPT